MQNQKHLLLSSNVLLPEISGELSFKSAAILINRGYIQNVTPLTDPTTLPSLIAANPAVMIHDFQEMMITPSFINSHTHLAMSFFRGLAPGDAIHGNMIDHFFFDTESQLTAEDVRAFTRMGAYESLLAGVGMVWDHYYYGKSVADGLIDTGLSGVVAPCLQDLEGPGLPQLEQQMQQTIDINSSEQLRSRGIFTALGPHATDTVSQELLTKIGNLASTYNLPIHMHLAQTHEELLRVQERAGCSPAEYLERTGLLEQAPKALFVHGIYLSQRDLALLSSAKHLLAFCPFSQMIFQFPAQVSLWEKAGIPWTVATDCVASNDSMNVQKELRLISGWNSFAMTNSEPYRTFAATGSSADAQQAARFRTERTPLTKHFSDSQFLLKKILSIPGQAHPQFTAGTITPGALANLTVWDTTHPAFWPERHLMRSLAMGDTTHAIHNMMVAGRWIGEPGNYHQSILHSKDFRAAQQEANERFTALRNRCGLN